MVTAADPGRHRPETLIIERAAGLDGRIGAVPLKVSEMIKVIEADGWYLERVAGSHRQFRHAVKPGTSTIVGKPSATLPPGTEKSILRRAGIE